LGRFYKFRENYRQYITAYWANFIGQISFGEFHWANFIWRISLGKFHLANLFGQISLGENSANLVALADNLRSRLCQL
jgi:hypothetical protein